jgi:hypothetical protein
MREAGASDQEAHEAAVAAVQEVLPLPWKGGRQHHRLKVASA